MSHSGMVSRDDISILIAEYVCGLLRPEEHVQVQVLLSRDDQALAQALAWEERLLDLVDALPRVRPDPALRERLQRTLGIGPPVFQPPPQPQLLQRPSNDPSATPPATLIAASAPATEAAAPPRGSMPAAINEPAPLQSEQTEAASRSAGQTPRPDAASPSPAEDATPQTATTQAPPPPHRHEAATGSRENASDAHRKLVRKLWFWRLMSFCALGAAIVGFMLPGEPPPPPVQVVKVAPTRAAILQAPGTSSTPGWTATLDPHGNLMMRPLVQTEVPTGSQVLLWTRAQAVPEPRLLGRIDPNRPVQVPSAQLGALAEDQLLEITLETDEDAAAGLPNGPILFIGQMTVFGSESAAGTAGSDAMAAASGAVTQETGR